MTAKAESEGRALLASMKAQHVKEHRSGLKSFCAKCGHFFPCDAARLIAALEEALKVSEQCDAPDTHDCRVGRAYRSVLAKLTEEAR